MFLAGVSIFVKQIHETCHLMVLTQRARGVAVLVDVRKSGRMRGRLALLEELYKAEEQVANGNVLLMKAQNHEF